MRASLQRDASIEALEPRFLFAHAVVHSTTVAHAHHADPTRKTTKSAPQPTSITYTLNTDTARGTAVVSANGAWSLMQAGGPSGEAHVNQGYGRSQLDFYVYGISARLGFFNGGYASITVDGQSATPDGDQWAYTLDSTSTDGGGFSSTNGWHEIVVSASTPDQIYFDTQTAISVTANNGEQPTMAYGPHMGPSYTFVPNTFPGEIGAPQEQLVDQGTFADSSTQEGTWTEPSVGPGFVCAETRYTGADFLFYAKSAEIWVYTYGSNFQVHLIQDNQAINSVIIPWGWGLYEIAGGLDTTHYHRYRLSVDCEDPFDASAAANIFDIMLVGGGLLSQPVAAPAHIAVFAGDSNTQGGAILTPDYQSVYPGLGNQSLVAFPYQLQQSEGGDYPVINEGIGGRPMWDPPSNGETGFGLDNHAMIADTVAACGNVAVPDVIVAMGTNDQLLSPQTGETIDDFTAATLSVYQQLRAALPTARIQFIGIPPQWGEFEDQVATWNAAYEQTVNSIIQGDPNVFYRDPAGAGINVNTDIDNNGVIGVHFNTTGVAKWISWIKSWLWPTWAAAPQVISSQVGDGSAQRSSIASISVTFNEPVNLADGTFSLASHATAPDGTLDPTTSTDVTTGITASTIDGMTWTLGVIAGGSLDRTITDAEGNTDAGLLANGIYQLVLHGSAIMDAATGTAQFNDGVDWVVQFHSNEVNGGAGNMSNYLHALYGDTNGDGAVDLNDYRQFKSAFGSSTGDTDGEFGLDSNGDGRIDLTDYRAFKAAYGQSYKY